MQKIKVKVRGKGQITLPKEIRDRLGVEEGSEILITTMDDYAILKPMRRTDIRGSAGALGGPEPDEVEFATIDPELLPRYYSKKYGE